MKEFKAKKLDVALEKQIAIKMITDTAYLNDVSSFLSSDYFTTSYLTSISEWVLEYFDEHKQAPNKDIENIFERKEVYMEDAEASLFRSLLENLSDKFDVTEDVEGSNDYIKARTLEFCQKRELEITSDNMKHYLEQGDIVNAEQELLQFRKVVAATSGCVDVFEEETVKKVFAEKKKGLFKLTGYLGDYLGDFHRGWLVVFAGAYKRGKSFWLVDICVNAVLSKLKVAFFSLEMTEEDLLERVYKRITGYSADGGLQAIPVMDCLLNQYDTCNRPERIMQPPLFVDEKLPEFDVEASEGYAPCTKCRDMPDSLFQPTTWFESVDCGKMTEGGAIRKAHVFSKFHKNHCKLKTYPRFSANISDIRRDLSVMESTMDFVPDVIIIDYADILKPESSNGQGVQKEDETWIALSQLAGEAHALLFTGTQITKDGQTAKTVSLEHQARWSGKLAHLDAIFGINATPEEKARGTQRINTILHRHKQFSGSQCVVLQNLDISAVHLDSYPYEEATENGGE